MEEAWKRLVTIDPGRADQQFEDVFDAFASYNRRRPQPTLADLKAMAAESKRNNPLHQKALAKRRKRKRGGPK